MYHGLCQMIVVLFSSFHAVLNSPAKHCTISLLNMLDSVVVSERFGPTIVFFFIFLLCRVISALCLFCHQKIKFLLLSVSARSLECQ